MSTFTTIGEALKKIQVQITCEICSQTFRDPRVLECLHVYCRGCLEDLVFDPISLACPSCRRTTPLNRSGTVDLLPAFHIRSLLQLRGAIEKVASKDDVQCEKCQRDAATAFCLSCWQYVCDECTKVHKLWSELASHELVGVANVRDDVSKLLPYLRNVNKAPACPVHKNRMLSMYCESCEKLLCLKCLSQKTHSGHAYGLVADVFESQQKIVEEAARTLRDHLAEANEAMLRFGPRLKEILDQRTDLEEQIRSTIRELHDDLELRRTEFLTQLRQVAQQKLRTLEAQKRDAELIRADLERTLLFSNQYLRAQREREIVVVSARVGRFADALLAEINVNSFVPLERADIVFRSSGLKEICGPCSAVRTTRVSPSHCRIADSKGSSVGPKYSKVVALTCGDTATFAIVIKDEIGEDFIEPVDVAATLTLQGVAAECAIEKMVRGHYNVRCTPGIIGRGVLNVCVNAQPIGGSPVPIVVRHPTQKAREPVMVICGLKLPHGIANSSGGNTVVVERGLAKVSVFTAFGTRIKMFGSSGSAPGQFKDPDGVTVDGSDNILVVDSGNHRIQKFTAEGEFITTVGTKGDGPLQFNLPTNIRIHPQSGNMYVCDQYNHRIQILKEDFSFVSSFGREGSEDGDFLYPTDLAFDSSGSIHIVDSRNDRIQVFTRGGRYLGQYRDKDNASSLSPCSICTDTGSDKVYVGECTQCVSVFTSLGRFVTSLGKKGSSAVDFAGPCRVAMHLGLVYVSDCDSGRVLIF